MKLKPAYDNLDDVPEQFHELYTERDGKFEFTGVEGLKTQADVERVQKGAEKERDEHKATKVKLKAFGELDAEQVVKDMDELEELRIRAEAGETGKIDDEKFDRLVTQRVAREKAPIERENKKLREENDALNGANTELNGTIKNGRIETEIRKHAEIAKVTPSAIDDVVMIGKSVFEIAEDGAIVTRDLPGITPGVGVDVYLTDMRPVRQHWWPMSTGGGANGDGSGGVPGMKNPWSRDNWNLTKQGEVVREHGADKADQLAKSAGVHVGATKPAPAKQRETN